ncbi:MAG: lipopolysaccharide kinase [Planctomycetaceae bacterium]|nr:lipopolysaccharide kinase [Planctomycetaceae bacterium]
MSQSLVTTDWDDRRLRVNQDFAELLRTHGLTTFESLMRYDGGEVAKHFIAERPTTRIVLQSNTGPVTLYLKRHAPAKLKEYLKPLIRLRWPRLGARPEWDAILRFQQLGIPTMTPVAIGQQGRESLLLTRAIEGCEKLSDWMSRVPRQLPQPELRSLREKIRELAETACKMHAAGLHHQDFYAGHILLPDDPRRGIHILDLGRVRQCRRLATLWVVKDLAQLHYSSWWFTNTDRLRFLKWYLGRPLRLQDRSLIRKIIRKASSIRRHSKKHGFK